MPFIMVDPILLINVVKFALTVVTLSDSDFVVESNKNKFILGLNDYFVPEADIGEE